MKQLLTILLALCPALLFSQNDNQCPCCAETYQQFDFWIGEWDVFNAQGQKVGTNTIQKIQGNCVLTENWIGGKGSTGTSFSYYDRKTKTWNQLWIDNSGGNLNITGNFRDGKMVLMGEKQHNAVKDISFQDRITWTDNKDKTVRQHWERTTDDGKSWNTLFDGLYKRKGE